MSAYNVQPSAIETLFPVMPSEDQAILSFRYRELMIEEVLPGDPRVNSQGSPIGYQGTTLPGDSLPNGLLPPPPRFSFTPPPRPENPVPTEPPVPPDDPDGPGPPGGSPSSSAVSSSGPPVVVPPDDDPSSTVSSSASSSVYSSSASSSATSSSASSSASSSTSSSEGSSSSLSSSSSSFFFDDCEACDTCDSITVRVEAEGGSSSIGDWTIDVTFTVSRLSSDGTRCRWTAGISGESGSLTWGGAGFNPPGSAPLDTLGNDLNVTCRDTSAGREHQAFNLSLRFPKAPFNSRSWNWGVGPWVDTTSSPACITGVVLDPGNLLDPSDATLTSATITVQ